MSTGASAARGIAVELRLRPLAQPLARRLRIAALVSAVSALVLVPCFWLPRIHAGDLSSHLYNAWLAQLVREGKVEGLAVTWQWTNILFDLLLRALMSVGGPRLAERVAVAAAVLVFFWGAFALASAMSRRHPWFMVPCLAGLAYGWTFRMGFFNFYLSLGLCLWALALVWRRGLRNPWAYVLLALAAFAHAMPAVWAAGVAVYIAAAGRFRPRRRWIPLACVLAGLGAVRLFMELAFETQWRFQQVASATGADQFWVYGRKYVPIFVAVLTLWGLLFLRLAESRGKTRTILGLQFQVLLLTAAGILVIPAWVLLPGHSIAFQFIDERTSVTAGVLACSFLASTTPSRLERAGMAAAVTAFFALLCSDAARWDRLEREMTMAVRSLPPGQRVVSQLCLAGSRVDPLRHMLDRACLGWCFSYGNYEPSSGQFSLRTLGPNRVVADERSVVWGLETGQHVVAARELPLYQVEWGDRGGRLKVRSLQPGERAGASCRTEVD
ncbi:MAG: hypothetical protein ACPL88_00090 [Bryobacteraceae bacterium]